MYILKSEIPVRLVDLGDLDCLVHLEFPAENIIKMICTYIPM